MITAGVHCILQNLPEFCRENLPKRRKLSRKIEKHWELRALLWDRSLPYLKLPSTCSRGLIAHGLIAISWFSSPSSPKVGLAMALRGSVTRASIPLHACMAQPHGVVARITRKLFRRIFSLQSDSSKSVLFIASFFMRTSIASKL